MKTEISKRFKKYEKSFNQTVSPRNYVVLRMDGHGFSKFTKNFNKPFDDSFSKAMDEAMIEVCKSFNAVIGYTQSDEISIMFTDIGNEKSQLIFDGKVSKIISLASSTVTKKFNQILLSEKLDYSSKNIKKEILNFKFGEFDARLMAISDIREVVNYFVWRQQDCTRNSISMATYHNFSPNELHKKNTSEQQDMLMSKGINWDKYAIKYKRGLTTYKEKYEKTKGVIRQRWVLDEQPIFTKDFDYLYNIINNATSQTYEELEKEDYEVLHNALLTQKKTLVAGSIPYINVNDVHKKIKKYM